MSVTFTGNLSINGVFAPAQPSIECIVTAYLYPYIITAKGNQMAYTLPVDKMIVLEVKYVDAHENPAKVDTVSWSASNSKVTAEVDSGSMSMCTVTPSGDVGTVQVVADADADLGTGVRHLITAFDITLVAGEAMAGVIEVHTEPQPIAPHPEPRP